MYLHLCWYVQFFLTVTAQGASSHFSVDLFLYFGLQFHLLCINIRPVQQKACIVCIINTHNRPFSQQIVRLVLAEKIQV